MSQEVDGDGEKVKILVSDERTKQRIPTAQFQISSPSSINSEDEEKSARTDWKYDFPVDAFC